MDEYTCMGCGVSGLRTCVGFMRTWVQASWLDLDLGLVILGANGGLGYHKGISLFMSCVTMNMKITFTH